jgi:PTH2 family peptidyl-tRNA hydrolase
LPLSTGIAKFEGPHRVDTVKQVIVVNESLLLPTGKLAAQVAHAAVAAFLRADQVTQEAWLHVGMPKIVVAVTAESDLVDLETRAGEAGIPAASIRDAGRTVVEAGTLTCLGLGPAASSEIDKLTGEFPLL